jgi:hypothetical protein
MVGVAQLRFDQGNITDPIPGASNRAMDVGRKFVRRNLESVSLEDPFYMTVEAVTVPCVVLTRVGGILVVEPSC